MADLLEELDRHPTARRILVDIRALPAPFYSDEQWTGSARWRRCWCWPRRNWTRCFASRVRWILRRCRWPRCVPWAPPPADRPGFAARLPPAAHSHRRVSGHLERAAGTGALDDGRLAARRRANAVLRRRPHAVHLRLPSSRGSRLPGIGRGRHRRSPFDVQRLRDNFRSAKPVVDWINSCFSRVMPQADDRDPGRHRIPRRRGRGARLSRISADRSPSRVAGVMRAGPEESAAIADMIARPGGQPSAMADRGARARKNACAGNRRQPSCARNRVPRRRHRASARSRGGSGHHRAEPRAAAPRRPNGVAGGAARALGGDFPCGPAGDFRRRTAGVGCLARRRGIEPAERRRPSPLSTAARGAPDGLRCARATDRSRAGSSARGSASAARAAPPRPRTWISPARRSPGCGNWSAAGCRMPPIWRQASPICTRTTGPRVWLK